MGGIASWLMTIIGPLALKVLAALGIGTLTFTGVNAGLAALITQAQNNWSGLAPDVLALASIAGIPEGIGLICGAMTARVGLWVTAAATRWIVK